MDENRIDKKNILRASLKITLIGLMAALLFSYPFDVADTKAYFFDEESSAPVTLTIRGAAPKTDKLQAAPQASLGGNSEGAEGIGDEELSQADGGNLNEGDDGNLNEGDDRNLNEGDDGNLNETDEKQEMKADDQDDQQQ
jgi:hypothetical protein